MSLSGHSQSTYSHSPTLHDSTRYYPFFISVFLPLYPSLSSSSHTNSRCRSRGCGRGRGHGHGRGSGASAVEGDDGAVLSPLDDDGNDDEANQDFTRYTTRTGGGAPMVD